MKNNPESAAEQFLLNAAGSKESKNVLFYSRHAIHYFSTGMLPGLLSLMLHPIKIFAHSGAEIKMGMQLKLASL